MRELKVVALGDSLIRGTAATGNRGWIRLLEDQLHQDGLTVHLHIAADGGNTVLDVAKDLDRECLDRAPDAVIVGVGTNDSRFRPSLKRNEVVLPEYEEALQHLFDKLSASDVSVVVAAGIVPVIDERTRPYKEDKYYSRRSQRKYDSVLASVAGRSDVLFLANAPRWIYRGENFIDQHLADGLHPNDDGHAELARFAYASLRWHMPELWKS